MKTLFIGYPKCTTCKKSYAALCDLGIEAEYRNIKEENPTIEDYFLKFKQTEEESLIFLYYKDFKISQTMGGLVMCDVRFIVLHTLENKINNLSFRLKWPSMETSLSYNDVEPNTETYIDYTLVGDGCYSMDKIPNVIVNRCRAKGLSQSACANKIRWLKKQ